MRGWLARLRHVVFRRRADAESAEEFEYHIELETRWLIEQGVEPAEAGRRARATFGGADRHREALRDGRRLPLVEPVVRDLRMGLRWLARRPGFTFVSVVTIALGVGASATVFSVANTLLFRPLPLPNADRLVTVDELRSGWASSGWEGWKIPYSRYRGYAEESGSVFRGLAARSFGHFSLRLHDRTLSVRGARTSGNYFHVVDLAPTAGAFYSEEGEASVVLSDRLWTRLFDQDPGAIGRRIELDGRPLTIVGIAPPGFHGATRMVEHDIWVPHVSTDAGMRDWVAMLGRLHEGVPLDRAEAVAESIAREIPMETRSRVRSVVVAPLVGVGVNGRAAFVGFLSILQLLAFVVLLTAAANIAGMLIARATSRQRELAIRVSLGAGRAGLIRHLACEGFWLFVFGGLGGWAVAWVGAALVSRLPLPARLGVQVDVVIDHRVLLFAIASATVIGACFSVAAAFHASRPGVVGAIRGGRPIGLPSKAPLRDVFAVGQVSAAAFLLIVATVLVASVRTTPEVDLGFDWRGVVTARTDLSPLDYDPPGTLAFQDQLVREVSGLPGVQDVTLGQFAPLEGGNAKSDVSNGLDDADRRRTNTSISVVDEAWFHTMRMPLVAGRAFEASDAWGATPVAIVNEALARRLWPGVDAVGQTLAMGDRRVEVIGVARDAKYTHLLEAETPFTYLPVRQNARAAMTLHIRAPGREAEVLQAIPDIVRRIEPRVAVEGGTPLESTVQGALYPQRLAAWFVGSFGVLGGVLAVLGVYGVLAWGIAQRTHEFGVRRALGATAPTVIVSVIRSALRLAGIGCVVGALLAAGGVVVIRSRVLGIDVAPLAGLLVPTILLTAAVAASLIPALRAVAIAPTQALRSD